VRVATVKRAPLALTLALTGSVEAARIAQLASPAEGPICCTKVREGAVVGKTYGGSITRLYPYLDSRTRTRITEITLTDAPVLLPSMFARANLVKGWC
jgi:hypothetical protein